MFPTQVPVYPTVHSTIPLQATKFQTIVPLQIQKLQTIVLLQTQKPQTIVLLQAQKLQTIVLLQALKVQAVVRLLVFPKNKVVVQYSEVLQVLQAPQALYMAMNLLIPEMAKNIKPL